VVDLRMVSRHQASTWARWAAPAAFLVAVTVVVLLVRAGLAHHSSKKSVSPPAIATTATTQTATVPYVQPRRRRYYRVQSGDTLSRIALRFQTTVPYIQLLNPGIDPANLTVGRRLRIH
jgi:LysM repeat protein